MVDSVCPAYAPQDRRKHQEQEKQRAKLDAVTRPNQSLTCLSAALSLKGAAKGLVKEGWAGGTAAPLSHKASLSLSFPCTVPPGLVWEEQR